MRRVVALVLLLPIAISAATPEDVFRDPPPEARAGVWWHWMGAQVTREGVVKDLDWMKRMGISSATVFGMCDSCTPWAKRIAGVPTVGTRPFSDGWWKLLRFACAEAKARGIAVGLHNCPGYTSTGGRWIPPRLAMRELVFGVTNVLQISTKPNAIFPVYDEDARCFRLPPCEARRTDYRRLGNIGGIEVGHVPMGAFVQPADWDSFGLECDKMNPEAVRFHLDHVLGELKRHLGEDLPAAGLSFVLLDSYEAGTPSWTPAMREEFKLRRGYDCWRFLPILGGYTNAFSSAEISKFRADWTRTLKDLYRDVLFRQMSERLRSEGLKFVNEPYDGPFEPREAAAHLDRVMTEFWYDPGRPCSSYGHGDFNTFRRADGTRHNIVEAEAFTGVPERCRWTETPALLKPCGDGAWLKGVNRFVLHACPLQPWGDEVKPGVTMGRWGTHFGRNQTWAESGKCWFDYVARSQALLQWGEPSDARLDVPFAQISREGDGRRVTFLVNDSDRPRALVLHGTGAWFDPTDGSVGAAPGVLAPRQSGFWVTGSSSSEAPGDAEAPVRSVVVTSFKPALGDWTRSADHELRYFSGTRLYRATFESSGSGAGVLSLGTVLGATAKVTVNGRDCGAAWCAPWTVRLPAGVIRHGENTLDIELTNVWANRLIGDEQEPPDVSFAPSPISGSGDMMLSYPAWFGNGLRSRPSKGRRCFTTWNYFTKDSPLVPSGLVGPVEVRCLLFKPLPSHKAVRLSRNE